ncbi:MAG: hypothetical protein KDD06_07610, partial [Phaeodactylibacter sp.]|nr:hypothetical protein [Phaeodactylibacter sp.]
MSDAIDFTLLRVAVFRLPERNQSRRASTWCQNMSHPKFQNDILWDIISGLQPELSASFRLGAAPQAAICQAFSLKG